MTSEEIKNKIIKFYNSNEYIELSSYYSYKNYFEILKVERDENTHSSFIAWLLDPLENHGLGNFPLERFFLLLAWAKNNLKCNQNSFFSEELMISLLTNDYEILDAEISREFVIEERKRIDILLMVKIKIKEEEKILPIIIENKVNSIENSYSDTEKKQTEIYYEWAEKSFVSKDYFKPMYVFLAPFSNSDFEHNSDFTDKCKCNKYIIISYQYLNNYVLEPCMQNKINDSAKILVSNYQRCLSYSDKEVNIMATNEEQKELLLSFWNNNKELLNAALSALIDDPETTDEDRTVMQKAFETISKRDNTKYSFNGESLGKGRLVLAVIKDYANSHPKITYEELDNAFQNARGGKSCIIRTKDITDERRYFKDDVLKIDGESVSVSSQWGQTNIDYFIEVARRLGYTIIPQN